MLQVNKVSSNGEVGLSSAPLLHGEPSWNLPICERYFTMIRSFRVEILFQYPVLPAPATPGTVVVDSYTAVKLSHLCDQLHLLVARLRFKQGPISRLEVAINFPYTHIDGLSYLMSRIHLIAVKVLLNTFRRLCKVDRPQVSSIAICDSQDHIVNILLPGGMTPESRSHYDEFLEHWSRELSRPQPSSKFVRALEGYWRLANLVSNIQHHCPAEQVFQGLAGFLANAKTAREVGDLQHLGKFWDWISALWFKYLQEHGVLQSRITQSIQVPFVL
jgi:hypothetical protein